ncbi:hypothetical protein GCM10011357_34870 [Lacimicrobium alkaliphilum]|uniref:O-antigen polymerase n=2 Tax=Lacimicrobium alkaliphilum TaxID=1526571 RepID=A0ABQ1RR77_9ALTE|nr:hypothetical protein GCM10011357_34870 [Lacimicrobium alkaliphilum]
MIWQVVGNIITDNPILGVGYSSVYHVGMGSILFDYADSWVEFVAHGHNGYLDLVLYLGFVGLFGYLFFFIYPYFKYSLILTREKLSVDDSIIVLSSVFVGVFFVLHNMTESSFFDTTRHGWVFFSFFFPILVVMNTYRKD